MKLSNVKFEELYKYCNSKNVPMFGNLDLQFPFLHEYKKDFSTYDFGINHDYSEFTLLTNKTELESVYNEWLELLNFILLKNLYKYKKLYDTLSLEYNPIENYSMTESGNDIRTPQLKTNIQTVYGADTTTETSTDSTMPYDSIEYVERNQNINEFTRHPRNDKTDTVNSGNETTTHEFTRKGNIGTLTTQSMIESERRVAYFSFFKVLIRDIISETCIIQDCVSWGCGE